MIETATFVVWKRLCPVRRRWSFAWSPAWGTLGHPFPSWWWSWQNCVDSASITDLHVCGPCRMKTAANFHPGIQRVENETYLFFLWILLGTQHGDPAWNLTPRTTQGLRLFCLFVFLRMEWPPEEWPGFPHSCGFFLCNFFFHVAQPCWHSDTVGLPCGIWPRHLDKAWTARNYEQSWFSHGSGKCPYPEFSFPSFVAGKKNP